jgi:hypothetical protein
VSRKVVQNCERLLFQRPDDAIHRGYDKQTEKDMARPGTFISNFQPLTHADARAMVEDVQAQSEFTEPMADLIEQPRRPCPTARRRSTSCARPSRGSSNGKRSKNPRYLQVRPDLSNPEATASADVALHLLRRVPLSDQCLAPVDIVAAGAATMRPSRASRRCAPTTRCTTWNCPSCSWSSSAR